MSNEIKPNTLEQRVLMVLDESEIDLEAANTLGKSLFSAGRAIEMMEQKADELTLVDAR